MVHPRPQALRDESVAKPETLLLIILSIVCKYYFYKGSPWKLVQSVIQKESHGRKHLRKFDNCRNSSPCIEHFILSKYWQHPVQDNQWPERPGHHRPTLFRGNGLLLDGKKHYLNKSYPGCLLKAPLWSGTLRPQESGDRLGRTPHPWSSDFRENCQPYACFLYIFITYSTYIASDTEKTVFEADWISFVKIVWFKLDVFQ